MRRAGLLVVLLWFLPGAAGAQGIGIGFGIGNALTVKPRGRLVVACDMTSDTCSDGRKITTTRSTPVPCEVAPGQWEMVPEDTGCYSVRGLESWAATTSYLAYGAELDREVWAKIAGAAVERAGEVWRASATSGSSFFVQTTPTLAGETWTASCRILAGTSTTIRMAAVQAAAGGSTVTRNLSPGWGTYSVTSTATADGNAGVWLYPAVGGAGDIYVAGCWLTKTTTPGRACWGGEAPVTCAADRHRISTEGWPTTDGEICLTATITQTTTAVLLDGRPGFVPQGPLLLVNPSAQVRWSSSDVNLFGPTIARGVPHRICAGRRDGKLTLSVNGVSVPPVDGPVLAWEPTAVLGDSVGSTPQHIDGHISSLRVRSAE